MNLLAPTVSVEPGVAPRLVCEVRHLRLIQAIAREQGVTRAAAWLNLTQSALSHQLLNLERDLDVKLFDRVGKRMVPSAAGHRLLAAANRVLGELAETELELRRAQAERTPLRVAAGCPTSYGWLAGVLARFGGEHPALDIQVGFQATRRELEALAGDEIDVAVTSRPGRDERFERRRLFSLDIVAVLAAGHPLAAQRTSRHPGVRWQGLAGQTLLIHDLPDDDVERLRAVVRGVGNRHAGSGQIWRVQLTEAIAELARAGHGVGVITRWSAEPFKGDRGLATMPLLPLKKRDFWAVWRRANPRGLPMRELAEHLARSMRTSG
ncbi:LysR family transcriptional regulator [Reyranella sp. CPCC 100927]|uniref:LysR family transcriptional regulator n=1 Tax=Reyranella sp. CPCC 100927 TaxID=2599616 RepID=UPI0011B5256B|nr:LysR family transcriptional regulator [Reyranella sp. CPCC 100927]TWS99917.1 LysR family transcriptional regulator [Reyranella sp. CPCC 100927]